MPRVKEGERKRARRPKTRSGCKTCKLRRIKCDEAKPACNRCTSTGRICDGYDPCFSNGSPTRISLSPVSVTFVSNEERRAFHYITDRSTNLSGFYEFKFWDRIILPAVHDDIAIRHAVIALASMHEDFERSGKCSVESDCFALRQYNLAIRQHLDNMTNTAKQDLKSVGINLASCMLFLCIEMLQGHYLSALSLVKGAMKLLNDYGPFDDFEGVESFISRVEIQAVGLFGPQVIGRTTLQRVLHAPRTVIMPSSFCNLAEAREYMDLFTWSQTLSNPLREAFRELWLSPDVLYAYSDLLAQWTAAFECLCLTLRVGSTSSTSSGASRDADRSARRNEAAIAILHIRRLMSATNLDLAIRYPGLQDEHTIWDECHTTFAEVVELAETVTRRPKPASGFRFTLDCSIGGPLHDAARICRDPFLRRRAIDLLRHNACREGLWDGLLAASIAQRVMQLEESSVPDVARASDIPAWARVGTVLATFSQNRRTAFVSYVTQLPTVSGITYQEHIDF